MSEEVAGPAIHAEVPFVIRGWQCVIPRKVTNGNAACAVIRLSKIELEFEKNNIKGSRVEIFGRVLAGNSRPCPKEDVLKDKNRLEIYRPLMVDPKKAGRK